MTYHGEASPHRILPAESLREQVERSVSARIVAGEFQPGEVLTVPTLAEQFGVSATPVREALQGLVRRGFLAPVRNKGFRVTEVSPDELREITEVRALLEVPPMRAVAGRIDDAMRVRLEQLAEQITRAYQDRRFEEYLAADTELHLTILSVTGNRRLVELVGDLRTQTRLVGLVRVDDGAALRKTAQEHAELVRLLVAGDGDGAAALMERHLGHIAGIWSGHDESRDDA